MAKSKGRRLAEWLRNLDSSGTVSNLTSTGIDDNATSTAITIDASENVGIGTTSPADELHVNSTSANVNLRLTRDTNTGARISGSDGASTPVIKFDTIASGTATERMRIDSSGNVGIGTASPDGKLNVFSASAGSVSADADADELVLENSGNVGLSLLTAGTGESGIYFGNPGTNGQKDFYLKFYHESHATTANRRAFTFNTASTERMRIDSSGNVGIGTDAPDAPLTIKEVSNVAINILKSSGQSLLKIGEDGSNHAVYNALYNEHIFQANGTERMRIDNSGNVGIGTSSPNEKLNVSGNIRVTSGFVSFSGSTSTPSEAAALYRPADNTLAISTANTERMRIDSSGRVGIGTTSPAYKLTVGGNSNSANNVLTGSNIVVGTTIGVRERGNTAGVGGNTYASQIYQGNSGGGDLEIYNISSTYSLVFGTNTTERMRINSSGNVGIGTTSPTNPLTVQANSGAGAVALNGRSSDGIATLSFYASNGTTAQGYVQGRSDSLRLWAASGDYLSLGSSDTERMRIDSSGKVGIGTASAGNLLHIHRDSSGGAWAQFTNTTTSAGASSGVLVGLDSNEDFRVLQYEAKAVKFYTSATERMRINSSGSVGIGTTSPAHSVEVSTGSTSRVNCTDGSYDLTTGIWANAPRISFGTPSSGNAQIDYHATANTLALTVNNSGGIVSFATNSTERMRIDASGNLLVGTTTTVGTGTEGVQIATNGSIITGRNQTSDQIHHIFKNPNGTVGTIRTLNNATSYVTSSDHRLKENIVDAPAGNIDAIRVRSFDWKADGTHQPYGMIAQELVDVAPEAVSQGETEDDMWGVDYSKLVPMMIKEIQDLKAEVVALKEA